MRQLHTKICYRYLTPGQLAGQMHAPRIHFKEHMHTEKTRLQMFATPNLGPKTGSIFGPTTRNSAFFLLLLPYHLGLNIWPAWPQLQRFFACQTGFTTKGYLLKVSLHNHNHMRSTQLLRLQAYTHTHTMRAHSHEARNACF